MNSEITEFICLIKEVSKNSVQITLHCDLRVINVIPGKGHQTVNNPSDYTGIRRTGTGESLHLNARSDVNLLMMKNKPLREYEIQPYQPLCGYKYVIGIKDWLTLYNF